MEESSYSTSLLVNTFTGVVFMIVLLLALVYRKITSVKGNLPPGPPSVPLLGSFPFLKSKDLRKVFSKLGEQYGNIFTVYLGPNPVVILNSFDIIKDALVSHGHAFAGRPDNLPLLKEVTKGYGIIMSQGRSWREQRQFTHGVLREFGMGRTLLEDKIKEEIVPFLECLKENIKMAFDPNQLISNAVSNIICSVVFGKRYDYGDPEFVEYLTIMDKFLKTASSNNPFAMIPMVRHIPGDPFGINQVIRNSNYLKASFRNKIWEHRIHGHTEEIRDFIDAYVKKIDLEKEAGRSDSTFHEEQLEMAIVNLFNAGTDTTATTLRWAIAYLLHYPDVQTKVHAEIREVLGDRLPSMKDKINLPYTEATILETQRLGDIVPFALMHSTTEDVEFHGYTIPKGTSVLPNLNAVHRDSTLWKNPTDFNPDRFLNMDGRVEKDEHLIPFSMGKRICLGESMARMELLLFFVAMMQHFTFKCPAGEELPDLTGHLGVTCGPKGFKVLVVPSE